ncbi:spermidine/putrescine ABC transporter substrate-binding protein [Streptomyces sp. NPDC051366]|uniref:spermidine/putrescine ABC transporter substrate-binding protein n=1 Tax=Streptomyces sp. NPDC051366 TaxID=3365652 RepID=UPI0037B6BDE7
MVTPPVGARRAGGWSGPAAGRQTLILAHHAPWTRRSFLRAGTTAALALTAAGCGFASDGDPAGAAAAHAPIDVKVDGDLVYFNWADFVDPAVFEGFQKEYGVKVVQSNFDSMEGMAAKLNAGNRYGIIFPTAKWSQRLAAGGRRQAAGGRRQAAGGRRQAAGGRRQAAGGRRRTIDHSRLKNAEAVFGGYGYFADPWYDPGSAHTVPFTMYKTGIGWRRDRLGDLTGSWSDLWNEQAKGKVFVLDDRDEVLGMGALKLGLGLSTGDPAELDRVTDTLRSLRPRLRGFSSDSYNNLLNGNADITQAWSGDMAAMLAQAEDPSVFGFEVAREGAPVNSDCYAIPANAQHPGTPAPRHRDALHRLHAPPGEREEEHRVHRLPDARARHRGHLRRTRRAVPAVPGDRRRSQGRPLLPQRRRAGRTGPRRRLDRREGRLT